MTCLCNHHPPPPRLSYLPNLYKRSPHTTRISSYFFQRNSRNWPLSRLFSLSLSSHMIYYLSGDLDHISIRNIRYSPAPDWVFLPINLMHFPSLGTIAVENGRPPRRSAVARKGSSSRRWIRNQLLGILHRREYITTCLQHWPMCVQLCECVAELDGEDILGPSKTAPQILNYTSG